MDVLLTRDVPNLGQAGQIKKVARGYARNFLIPKGLAVPATEGALTQAKLHQQAEARRQRKLENQAQILAQIISRTTLTFQVKAGESDRLYGSITNADIAQALEQEIDQTIDKRKIELSDPIRELGTHQVPIRLLSDLAPEVTVIVDREE
jgi:large subunit ribosomal protein L9